jgi:arylsulfatase A-like enzyme
MDRRGFLQTTGGAASSLALANLSCGEGGRPPNVVVVFTDQFRAFEAGCYGHPVVRTPHIDRLAGGGFRFDVGVTNSPVCSPARANMLSGQYARTSTGSIENVGSIGTSRTRFPDPTMPEIFREAGYDTGHVGKWHVHLDPFLIGFDYAYYPVEIPHQYYGREMREAWREKGKLSTDTGERAVADGFMPQKAGEKMREYIRSHKDEPFFLNYCISLPHMPIGPGNLPEKYVGMYDRNDVVLRDNVWKDGELSRDEWWFKIYMIWDYYWRTRGGGSGEIPADQLPDGFDLRDLYARYYEAVTCTDDLVGEVMAALEENGIADNTIVVLSSDHGDLLGSHDAYNKDRVWEEAIRVPMIYHHPDGWGKGETAKQVASNVDILPTVLAACGLDIPGHVQGQNLLPVIRQERPALDRDYAFIEVKGYSCCHWVLPRSQMGIRTPTHKYGIELEEDERAVRDDRWLFHDLRDDPFELNNLAASSVQAGLADELREKVVEWHGATPWSEVTDELPGL